MAMVRCKGRQVVLGWLQLQQDRSVVDVNIAYFCAEDMSPWFVKHKPWIACEF